MTQQIEVEPTEIRAPVRDPRRAGSSKRENAPHSAKRIFTTFIIALVFAFAVIAGPGLPGQFCGLPVYG